MSAVAMSKIFDDYTSNMDYSYWPLILILSICFPSATLVSAHQFFLGATPEVKPC